MVFLIRGVNRNFPCGFNAWSLLQIFHACLTQMWVFFLLRSVCIYANIYTAKFIIDYSNLFNISHFYFFLDLWRYNWHTSVHVWGVHLALIFILVCMFLISSILREVRQISLSINKNLLQSFYISTTFALYVTKSWSWIYKITFYKTN